MALLVGGAIASNRVARSYLSDDLSKLNKVINGLKTGNNGGGNFGGGEGGGSDEDNNDTPPSEDTPNLGTTTGALEVAATNTGRRG